MTEQFKDTKPQGQAPEKKKRRSQGSEYKKSLVEKQALKDLYGLSERQFKRYVKETLAKMGKVENVAEELIKRLEKRLDNVVFRMGFAKTRAHARQMVSHAYFLVNGKPVNIPSYQVQKDDVMALKETKKKKAMLKELPETSQKMQTHTWLQLDAKTLECKVIGEPSLLEVNPPVQIPLVFEFYSR
jgi:small subunit ribosomal protein S4